MEAHVLTPRMVKDNQAKADFPYVSVIATGGHTQINLTRGVGLHTILGFSYDIGVGTFFDASMKFIDQRKDILEDTDQI